MELGGGEASPLFPPLDETLMVTEARVVMAVITFPRYVLTLIKLHA